MSTTQKQQVQATENRNIGIRCAEVDSIRAVDGDGNERRFILSFSSEEPYIRFRDGRIVDEILSHKKGAVDLSRLNNIGVLLFNHNTDYVCGKILRAWVENERGQAEVEFDTDEAAELICQKVKSGTLKATSVRYGISDYVIEDPKETNGGESRPRMIVRKWTPMEVSIVSVPADATVGVGRAHEPETPANTNEAKSGRSIRELQLQLNQSL